MLLRHESNKYGMTRMDDRSVDISQLTTITHHSECHNLRRHKIQKHIPVNDAISLLLLFF